MEKQVIYYQDELNDDFAGNDISTKKIKNEYKYVHKGPLFKLNAFLVKYLIAVPWLWIANKSIFRTKVVNKKVLKCCKKKGYYLYSNHVLPFDPVVLPIMTQHRKTTVIIAGPDLFSICGFVNWVVKHMYAIPVPNNDLQMMDNFTDCLDYHINKGHRVLIYPEAHIWPYYNDIRHFKSVSFKYPVNQNVPIFTATTTFKQRKGNKKPKPIVYIDGPFYPDETLPVRDRVNDLAERAYEAMCYRAHTEDNYAYIEYKKKSE